MGEMVEEGLGVGDMCSPSGLFQAGSEPQGPLYGSISSQLGAAPPEGRRGLLARLRRSLGGRRRSPGHLDTQSLCPAAAGRRSSLAGLLRGLRASRGSLQEEPAPGTPPAWSTLFKPKARVEQVVEEVVKMETDFRNVSLSPEGGEGRGRKSSLRPSLSLVWQEIAPSTASSTPPASHQARRITMDDSGFSEAEAAEGQPFGTVDLTDEMFLDMFTPSTSTTPSISTTPAAASSTCPSTCPATNSSHLASTSTYLTLSPTTSTRITLSPTTTTTTSTPVPSTSTCLILSPTSTSTSLTLSLTTTSTSTSHTLRSRLATNLFHSLWHRRRGAQL